MKTETLYIEKGLYPCFYRSIKNEVSICCEFVMLFLKLNNDIPPKQIEVSAACKNPKKKGWKKLDDIGFLKAVWKKHFFSLHYRLQSYMEANKLLFDYEKDEKRTLWVRIIVK